MNFCGTIILMIISFQLFANIFFEVQALSPIIIILKPNFDPQKLKFLSLKISSSLRDVLIPVLV